MRKYLGAFLGLLLKIGLKMLSVLAKLAKIAKVAKVGMGLATFASYSYMFSWKFALMVMTMLFVHESGHVWAMKRCGMKTKGFYFVPFLGGAAVPDEDFPTRWIEVYVAIMGPVFGGVLAVVCATGYFLTGYKVLAACAAWMCLIQVINLLPINPLDGGRIFKSIAFSLHSWIGLWFMGLGFCATIWLMFRFGFGFVLCFISFLGLVDFLTEFLKRRRKSVPVMGSFGIAVSFGLFILVGGGLFAVMLLMNHVPGADIAMQLIKD